jgi:hypothetical protein
MPTTIGAILVIAAFLMPGFIANRFLAFVYPSTEPGETRAILTAITFSCLNYAVLSWFLIVFWVKAWYDNLAALAGFAFFVLFLAPLLITWMFTRIVASEWGRSWRHKLGLMHPMPKAWDYFFHLGRPCWIVATLKNGRTFAGYYGGKSFASSFPAEEDLYLEVLCNLSPQGKIVNVAPSSAGGIIKMDVIDTLEFFDSDPTISSLEEKRG